MNDMKDMERLLSELKTPEIRPGQHKDALKPIVTSQVKGGSKFAPSPIYTKVAALVFSVLVLAVVGFSTYQSNKSNDTDNDVTQVNTDKQEKSDFKEELVDEMEEVEEIAPTKVSCTIPSEGGIAFEQGSLADVTFDYPNDLDEVSCNEFQSLEGLIKVSAPIVPHGLICDPETCVTDEDYKPFEVSQGFTRKIYIYSDSSQTTLTSVLYESYAEGSVDIDNGGLIFNVSAEPGLNADLELLLSQAEQIVETHSIKPDFDLINSIPKPFGTVDYFIEDIRGWDNEKNYTNEDGSSYTFTKDDLSITIKTSEDGFSIEEEAVTTDVLWEAQYVPSQSSNPNELPLKIGHLAGNSRELCEIDDDILKEFDCSNGDGKLTVTLIAGKWDNIGTYRMIAELTDSNWSEDQPSIDDFIQFMEQITLNK